MAEGPCSQVLTDLLLTAEEVEAGAFGQRILRLWTWFQSCTETVFFFGLSRQGFTVAWEPVLELTW